MNLKYKLSSILFLGLLILGLNSCEDYDFETDDSYTKLFRPPTAMADEISATDALLTWTKVNGTHQYIVQLSNDSLEFNDVTEYKLDASLDTLRVTDLYSESNYSFRVMAVDTLGTVPNSGWIEAFFATKGEQLFESFYQTMDADANKNILKLNWIPGSKVTAITLQPVDGEVQTIDLTAEEIAAGEKQFEELAPSTEYSVKLMRDASKRGEYDITTYDAFPDGYLVLPEGATISNFLMSAPANATVVIPSKFNVDNPVLEDGKLVVPDHILTLQIVGVPDTVQATVQLTSIDPNLTMTDLTFENLDVDCLNVGGNYLMNNDKTIALKTITIDNCMVHNCRGMLRFKNSDTATEIEALTINNSIINNVGGYGLINNQKTLSFFNNIILTNSTFSNVERFMQLEDGVRNSLVITDCSFYNTLATGRYLFDIRVDPTATMGTVTLNNLIFGKFWYEGAYDGTSTVNCSKYPELFSFNNSYYLSDFVINEAYPFNMMQGYGSASDVVFADPANEILPDLTIIDGNFPAQNSVGDPRWYNY